MRYYASIDLVTNPQDWQPPTTPGPARPRYGEYVPRGVPLGTAAGASDRSTTGGVGDPLFSVGPPEWTPPPKPGLIPLRPLGFGTLLGAPFQVLRRNPKATFGSALLVQAAVTLVSLVVVGLVTVLALNRVASAPIDERDAIEAGANLTMVLSAVVPVALSVIAAALLQGVIVVEVARATLGEKLRLAALWRAAGRRLWTLVLWTVLLGLALLLAIALVAGVVVALVLLGQVWLPLAVIVGIFGVLAILGAWSWVYTRTSLVPSLIVLERLTIGDAVRRSWFLTTGYFWRTLGVQLLVAVIVNLVAQVVTTPLSILFGMAVVLVDPNGAFDAYIPSWILFVLIMFVSLVLGAVAAVVQSAATVLIYLDLRMRKEGLDLDLQHFVESAQAGRNDLPDPYLHATLPGANTAPGSPGA